MSAVISAELRAEVEEWIALDPDPKTAAQLQGWLDSENVEELNSAFSGFLQFGTAGLRGPIGPGPSRMNRAVVARAAAGIAAYMKERGLSSVVIGRDARYGSEDFTFESAAIFSGAGMKVYVLPRSLPTPVLAYAVRDLNVDCGIMVTASHNPPQDNGYKVYLGGVVDGINYNASQIVSPADEQISAHIATQNHVLTRADVWEILNDDVLDRYVARTVLIAPDVYPVRAIYTAMHGVGTETVEKVFAKAAYADPILVKAQTDPDPDFPTVAFPNPEEPGAIDLSLVVAREHDGDVVIANDPDADRCAAAINDGGTWRMLSGDELGALFGEYLASNSPEKYRERCFANSIVSSSLLSKIANHHGIEFHETLTGFKWLAKLENLGFGYEEAIGYSVDPQTVNDKDGVSAAIALARIAGELKSQGSSISQYLKKIREKYGFHKTIQISIRVADLHNISRVLNAIRAAVPSEIAGYRVERFDDLLDPSGDLPPTDGVRFYLEEGIRVIIRPSGTEPKVKCYIEVVRNGDTPEDHAAAEAIIAKLSPTLKGYFQ
jgi:phosphomannomutase